MKFPTRTLNLFLTWILFSLLAIAYIGEHPFLGLAIAIVGGIVLGVLSFLYYEPPTAAPPESPAPPAEDPLSGDEESCSVTSDTLESEADHDGEA